MKPNRNCYVFDILHTKQFCRLEANFWNNRDPNNCIRSLTVYARTFLSSSMFLYYLCVVYITRLDLSLSLQVLSSQVNHVKQSSANAFYCIWLWINKQRQLLSFSLPLFSSCKTQSSLFTKGRCNYMSVNSCEHNIFLSKCDGLLVSWVQDA